MVLRRTALFVLLLAASSGVARPAQPTSSFLGGRGMPYAAFDRLPQTDLKVAGAALRVGIAPGKLAVPPRRLFAWIAHSARVIAAYYGRFPVASVRILIVPVGGNGVRGGTTWGYRGAAIRLLIGSEATANDLQQDWMIVHEMVHLALPNLDQRHDWLSEGLATYIEPIARVQAGDLTAQSIWAAMVRDMPKGLPQAGDRGLDYTPTWGRTYWGGAIFCLLADVEIHEQTGDRRGLQDAMRGVLAAGGNQEVRWPIGRVLATADRATGTQVLTDLYARMGSKPFAPDLGKLWRELGVERQPDGSVVFNDKAPLARIRHALTQPPR